MNRLQTNVDCNLSYLKKGEYKLEGEGAIKTCWNLLNSLHAFNEWVRLNVFLSLWIIFE